MKKRYLKILALIAALGLILFLSWFANSLLGNPLSKTLASKTAEDHLLETYAETDFYIERVTYSFKDGCYHAFIKSPSSMDTEFSLTIDMYGRLVLDTYPSVLSGSKTARRLIQEYRELTDLIFESPNIPYNYPIGYGTLEIYPKALIEDPAITDIPVYSLVQDDLVLDKIYDIPKLGAQAGHLIIYIDSDTLSPELAAQIMLEIRSLFDDAGIPFYAMDFMLQYPLPEEGPRPDEYIGVKDFLYEDIYPEDMVDRVIAADEALKAYYAAMDAVK